MSRQHLTLCQWGGTSPFIDAVEQTSRTHTAVYHTGLGRFNIRVYSARRLIFIKIFNELNDLSLDQLIGFLTSLVRLVRF